MVAIVRGTPGGNYVPQPYTGDDSHELVEWLMGELQRVSTAFNIAVAKHIDTSFAAPSKPRDGDIVFADGTKWNPGSGQGYYGYYNAAWHFLG